MKNAWENYADCCICFPWFSEDIDILIDKGVLKRTTTDYQYEWTKSKTSLAEYFKWIGKNAPYVPGGFWAPIEYTFLLKGEPIKRGDLRRLAGKNGNGAKPDESRDFKEIKKFVLQYRKETKERLKTFHSIRKLIKKAKNENPKTVKTALEKIKEIFA